LILHSGCCLADFLIHGDGRTFGRRFKGTTKFPRFGIENFILVRDWTIESMDFRELFQIYNKPRVLMYLDPPYLSSGRKYRHSFTIDNLKELKMCMDDHSGSYLLNLSSFDEGMEEIFGRPDRIIDYANPVNNNGKEKWGCGYWWASSFESGNSS
jgi:site-specific DNA-adenine methylase